MTAAAERGFPPDLVDDTYVGPVETRWTVWPPTRYSDDWAIGWTMYREGDVLAGPLNGGVRQVDDPDDPSSVCAALRELVDEWADHAHLQTVQGLLAIGDGLMEADQL